MKALKLSEYTQFHPGSKAENVDLFTAGSMMAEESECVTYELTKCWKAVGSLSRHSSSKQICV